MELNIKKNAFDYFSYLLIFTLPFSTAIPNIILMVLSILFLKDVFFERAVKIQWKSFALLISLFLYLFAKAAIYGTYFADHKIYNGYLLILWVLAVLQHVKNIERLKLVVLLMVTATTICSFVLIANYYLQTHILPFSNGSETNMLLILQRPYAGFTAVFGFFLSIGFIKSLEKYKWWFAANAVLMVLFIVIVSARLSLVTIFFMGIVFLMFYYKISIYKKLGLTLALLGVVACLLVFNRNISQRFFITKNLEKSIEAASDLEPRVVIWGCANQMVREPDFNPFLGFESYNGITKRYLACYASKIDKPTKREYFLFENFNSHNQFIDFYLIGGLIATMLFIAFLVNLFFKVKTSYTALALFLSFLFFFALENVFYRQYGCFLFAIFSTLYIKDKNRESI